MEIYDEDTDLEFYRTFRPANNPLIMDPRTSKYRASASLKSSPSLQDGVRLSLQGLLVDEIGECTSRPLQASEQYDIVDMAMGAGLFSWYNAAAQIARSLKPDTDSSQPDNTSFWKTLAADTKPSRGSAPPSFGDEYRQVREYLELLDHCDYDPEKVACMPNARYLEDFSDESIFLDTWFWAAFQRNFCSTKEGRMGLVPGAALKGDLIAIILGADVPFVLRTTSMGRYVLIGECYIHGIMKGEAIRGREAQLGDITLQ